jgi:hypothetical protein
MRKSLVLYRRRKEAEKEEIFTPCCRKGVTLTAVHAPTKGPIHASLEVIIT